MSKYLEVVEALKYDILAKEYKDKLPSQYVLAKKYGVSRVTLSRVFKVLEAKGLIKVVKGHGTYIVSKKIAKIFLNSDADEYEGLNNKLQGLQKLESKIISFDLRLPEENECATLHLNPNQMVYDIIRLRSINGEPIKLEYTIMPQDVIPGVSEKVLQHSIYNYIRNELKHQIGKATRIISADKSDAYDELYLNCDPGDAILSVRQTVYLDNGVPFEYSETRNRYDKGSVTISNVWTLMF